MADPRDNGQGNRLTIELLGSSRPPHSAAMLAAGVVRDFVWYVGGTSRVQASNQFDEVSHVLSVHRFTLDLLPLAPDRSLLLIAQAFLLSVLDCLALSENALPFVSLAGPAPLQDNRGEA